jgi:hypothetical protein
MKPVNYFRTCEFRTAAKTGFVSGLTGALTAGFNFGFRAEVLFPAFVSGFAGVFCLANDQINTTPNIYTPRGLPLRDERDAVLSSVDYEVAKRAEQTLVQNSTGNVIAVARSLVGDVVNEIVPPRINKTSIINNVLGRLF